MSKKPAEFPTACRIELPAVTFDVVRELVDWTDRCPMWLELGDHTWERITEHSTEDVERVFDDWACDKQSIRETWCVTSIQIDPDGVLVALFAHDDDGPTEPERHVRIYRGPDLKKTKKRKATA